jgi:hypothetical protein
MLVCGCPSCLDAAPSLICSFSEKNLHCAYPLVLAWARGRSFACRTPLHRAHSPHCMPVPHARNAFLPAALHPHHRPCRATITPVPLGGCRRFELRLSWPAEDTMAKGRPAHAGPFALDVPPGLRFAGYCSPRLGRPWAPATPVLSVSDLCFKCFI